jgi:hypothetical protein
MEGAPHNHGILGTGGSTTVSNFGGSHGGASPDGSLGHCSEVAGFFCPGHGFLLLLGHRPPGFPFLSNLSQCRQ